MDVETVCTEAQLQSYLGSALTGPSTILPKGWTDCEPARVQALADVLKTLSRRMPPIREADIGTPSELADAVKYGAEKWLLWHAMNAAGDQSIFAFKYKVAEKRFDSEVEGLTPTLAGGVRGAVSGFSFSRR